MVLPGEPIQPRVMLQSSLFGPVVIYGCNEVLSIQPNVPFFGLKSNQLNVSLFLFYAFQDKIENEKED